MTYADRMLSCVDCGVEFIHSAADQEYYVQKGFASDPKRCASCRASRRASRDGGYDVQDIGGPRGYERGELPLALGRGGLAEVVMTGAEMDVRGVKQSEHPAAAGLPVPFPSEQRGEVQPVPGALAGGGFRASEAPPGPRSPPRLSAAIVTGRLSRSPAHRRAAEIRTNLLSGGCNAGFRTSVYGAAIEQPVRPETGTP